MNYGLLARRFIFFAVAVIALIDLYLAAFGGPGSTISLQLFKMTEVRHGSLIFAFGYIAGHVFGRIDSQN